MTGIGYTNRIFEQNTMHNRNEYMRSRRICPICGNTLSAKHKQERFCSIECKQAARTMKLERLRKANSKAASNASNPKQHNNNLLPL